MQFLRARWFLLGAIAAVAIPAIAATTAFHQTNALTCTALSNVALSTSSETLFAAAAARKTFCVVNNDASIAIHVKLGATATTADTKVAAGASMCWEPTSGHVYAGVVDAIAASGTPAVSGFSCE